MRRTAMIRVLLCACCTQTASVPVVAQNAPSAVGVWAGRMAIGDETTEVRIVFSQDPFGGFTGAVAFRRGAEMPQSGRAELSQLTTGPIITITFNTGIRAEFRSRTRTRLSMAGDVRVSAGPSSIREGRFELTRESGDPDLHKLLSFTTGSGAVYVRSSDSNKTPLYPRPIQRAFVAGESSEARDIAKSAVLR